MFTSRAEFRLTLRADNADLRLTPTGIRAGCVGSLRAACFETYRTELNEAHLQAVNSVIAPAALRDAGAVVKQDGQDKSVFTFLGHSGLSQALLAQHAPWLSGLSTRVLDQLGTMSLYTSYIARQEQEIRGFRREEHVPLDPAFDFSQINGLSTEMRERLTSARPQTLGAASRVPGITPAAVAAVASFARRDRTSGEKPGCFT